MKEYDVSRLPPSITLGWDGENNWRPIAFDCAALLTGHPEAVVTLWLLPKGEAQAFPVALERDGDTVVWTPLNEEMTAERGQLQIVAQDGTDVGKSRVIDYTVRDSLVGGADHPAEAPSWAGQVVEDVTKAASHYPRIGDNGNWFVWDITAGEWVDTGVAAGGGGGGEDGFSPAVTITAITGGHRVTITDKDHPSGQTFDVMDGEEGAPGRPGVPGTPGTSPSVSVTTITGGHRVTITDAAHPQGQSIDVMDGSDYVLTQDDLQAIAALVNLSGKADKIPTVVMTAQDTVVTIEPNKEYVFPEMAALDITAAEPSDPNTLNEYHFWFDSGSTATVLALPDDWHAPDGKLVEDTSWQPEANQTYEISVVRGKMLESHWDYEGVTA